MTKKNPPTCKLGKAIYTPTGAPETSCYIGLTRDEAGEPVVIFAPEGNSQLNADKLGALASVLIQQLPELARRHPATITWYTTAWLRDIDRAANAGLAVAAYLNRENLSRETARSLQQVTFRLVASTTLSDTYRLDEPVFSEPGQTNTDLVRRLERAYERVCGPVRWR